MFVQELGFFNLDDEVIFLLKSSCNDSYKADHTCFVIYCLFHAFVISLHALQQNKLRFRI